MRDVLLPLLLAGDAKDNADALMIESIEPLKVSAHSEPYSNTDSTHAWYTCRLVVMLRFLSLKTAWWRAPKVIDALSMRLSTSAYILALVVTTEQR